MNCHQTSKMATQSQSQSCQKIKEKSPKSMIDLEQMSVADLLLWCTNKLNSSECNIQVTMARFLSVISHADKLWFLSNGPTRSGEANTESNCGISISLESVYVRFAETLSQVACVPKFHGREDIGYETNDFTGVAQTAHLCMEVFAVIVTNLPSVYDKPVKGDARCEENIMKIVKLLSLMSLMLALEHQTGQLWTSDDSVNSAHKIVDTILMIHEHSCINDLLCGVTLSVSDRTHHSNMSDNGFLCPILSEIKPKLCQDVWKNYPSVQHVFSWLLFNIKSPCLEEYLSTLLPMALIITDDHQLENKILGIRCLQHIMNNVSASQLRWNGRAEVVWDSLQRYTYSHDATLLQVLYPALLCVLHITEQSPKKTDGMRVENKFDEIFQRLLTDMELEQRIVLRRTYSQQLPSFISAMGITIVRHFKRLFKVIFNYLETSDGPEEISRLNVLKALMVLLAEAWLVIPTHCDAILKGLLRLSCDLLSENSVASEKTNTVLHEEIKECLMLLKRSCPKRTSQLLKGLVCVPFEPQSKTLIAEVLVAE